MNVLVYLVPMALGLGLAALLGFLWSVRNQQYDDLEGAALRILSDDDVERMVEDSFTYAEADVEARLLIEARNEADTVITHVRRALRQGAHLVTPEERAHIEAALAALTTARDTTDRDRIREATTAMNNTTEHLAELMMDSALKGALGGARAREILESP